MTRLPCNRPPARGFTLVELLVVMHVLGLAAALLLPAIGVVRDQARLVGCTANLRRVTAAVAAAPGPTGARYAANTSHPAPGRYWYHPRQAGAALGLRGNDRPAVGGPLACPADDGGARSYAMNIWASGAVDKSVLVAKPAARPWGRDALAPQRLILVAEALSYTGSADTGWLAQPTIGFAGDTAGQRFGGGGGLAPPIFVGRFDRTNSELAFMRHRSRRGPGVGAQATGRANIGYADGHVALRSDADLVDAAGRSTGDSVWYPGEQR